jgi:hypothetical protein
MGRVRRVGWGDGIRLFEGHGLKRQGHERGGWRVGSVMHKDTCEGPEEVTAFRYSQSPTRQHLS